MLVAGAAGSHAAAGPPAHHGWIEEDEDDAGRVFGIGDSDCFEIKYCQM
jgi:hypothetical protein